MMNREFWKVVGGGLAFIAGLTALIIFMLYQILKDVTIEGLAEDAGKAATKIERAYERGKSDDR